MFIMWIINLYSRRCMYFGNLLFSVNEPNQLKKWTARKNEPVKKWNGKKNEPLETYDGFGWVGKKFSMMALVGSVKN